MVLVYGLVLGPVLHAVADHAGELDLPEAAQEWVDPPGAMGAQSPPSEDESSEAEELGHSHAVDGHGHEHGHSHRHGKGKPHRHAWGAVEHLQAVALSQPLLLLPAVRWERLHAVAAPRREWVPVAPLRPTAMPQGP